MRQIKEYIGSLGRIFHSEADFQHALALELQRTVCSGSTWDVRVEYPIGPNKDVDICLVDGEAVVPIELKYKQDELSYSDGEEVFNLSEQRARGGGHYDFLIDVRRIEQITADTEQPGFAILLTNDSGYWQEASGTLWDAFRLYDGRTISGKLEWDDRKEYGDGKDEPMILEEAYELKWRDYPYPETDQQGQNDRFRYLVVSTNDPRAGQMT